MLLIDTCVLLWMAGDRARLSPSARRAIESPSETLHVSAVSALEVGLAHKRRRLALPLDPRQWFEEVLIDMGLTVLPVTWEVALASATLPDVHADPFDRIIVATALAHGAIVVSPDPEIAAYPRVTTVW